jgi:hypothetical protein
VSFDIVCARFTTNVRDCVAGCENQSVFCEWVAKMEKIQITVLSSEYILYWSHVSHIYY